MESQSPQQEIARPGNPESEPCVRKTQDGSVLDRGPAVTISQNTMEKLNLLKSILRPLNLSKQMSALLLTVLVILYYFFQHFLMSVVPPLNLSTG